MKSQSFPSLSSRFHSSLRRCNFCKYGVYRVTWRTVNSLKDRDSRNAGKLKNRGIAGGRARAGGGKKTRSKFSNRSAFFFREAFPIFPVRIREREPDRSSERDGPEITQPISYKSTSLWLALTASPFTKADFLRHYFPPSSRDSIFPKLADKSAFPSREARRRRAFKYQTRGQLRLMRLRNATLPPNVPRNSILNCIHG